MEKHVTDLETSKRLAEVGVNNISKWYHCIPFNGRRVVRECEN